MATVKTNKSPLHIKCEVGYPYGVADSGYSCGYHTGCDFPQSGTSATNPDLFSVVEDGEIVYTYTESTGTSPALGNQVQIKDNKTGYYYRYCHLLYNSIVVKVGDKVNLTTKLGKMGNTGNSTGTHLHLELSKTMSWTCGEFLNPVEPLGIPNERGTIVEYETSKPRPEPPTQDLLRQGELGYYYGNTYNTSQALTNDQMSYNTFYIYDFLTNKGWTLNAICGMLGNMQTESSINPRKMAK